MERDALGQLSLLSKDEVYYAGRAALNQRDTRLYDELQASHELPRILDVIDTVTVLQGLSSIAKNTHGAEYMGARARGMLAQIARD